MATVYIYIQHVIFIVNIYYQYPPVFSYKKLPDGNYTHQGLGYDYLQWIKEHFDFRYVHTHFINFVDKKFNVPIYIFKKKQAYFFYKIA